MMGRMDDPTGAQLDAALTLGALATEMGPRLDAIEAAAQLRATERWPLSDVMPVRRTTSTRSGDVIETGVVRAGDGAVVIAAGDMPVAYADFEAMARDGWRPD